MDYFIRANKEMAEWNQSW